jgi:hypothetical protein
MGVEQITACKSLFGGLLLESQFLFLLFPKKPRNECNNRPREHNSNDNDNDNDNVKASHSSCL